MNEQGPLKQAIDALERAERYTERAPSIANAFIAEAVATLRALQSQPATDGMGKVREALEFYSGYERNLDGSENHNSEKQYAPRAKEAIAILDQKSALWIPAGWKLVPVEAVVRLNAISKQWSVDEIKHNEKYEDCDFESGYDEMVKNIREIQSMLSAAPDLNGEG